MPKKYLVAILDTKKKKTKLSSPFFWAKMGKQKLMISFVIKIV